MKATADDPALVVEQVLGAMQSVSKAYAMLALHGTVIEAQPDFSSSLLPTLPEDQGLLREHVGTYESSMTLSGGLQASLSGVRTTSARILFMSDAMEAIAEVLDRGPQDPSYKTRLQTFEGALDELARVDTSLDPNDHSVALRIQTVHHDLQEFRDELDDDLVRLQTALEQAKYSGEIGALQAQIAGLLQRMNGINEQIAEGATTQIGPALEFGFSVGKTLATTTGTGKLVLGAAFAIRDEVKKANAFEKAFMAKNAELDQTIDEYKGLIEKLEGDEQQMSVLLTIVEHAKIYRDSFDGAIAAVGQVSEAFEALRSGIERLTLVDVPPAPGFFEDQLRAAHTFWLDVELRAGQHLQLLRNT